MIFILFVFIYLFQMITVSNTSIDFKYKTQYNDFYLDINLKNNIILKDITEDENYNFSYSINITHNFDRYYKLIESNEIIKLIEKQNSITNPNGKDNFIEILKKKPGLIISSIQNNNFTIEQNFNNVKLSIFFKTFDIELVLNFKKNYKENSHKFKIDRLEKKCIELEKKLIYIDTYQKHYLSYSPIKLFFLFIIIYSIINFLLIFF